MDYVLIEKTVKIKIMSLSIKIVWNRVNRLKNPTEKALIHIRFTLNRKIGYINSGIRVIKKQWDFKHEKVNTYAIFVTEHVSLHLF